MANNEFLITDVVDKKAFDELTRLQGELSATISLYVQFTQNIAKTSSSNPKTFEELTAKARNYEASLEKLNKTGSEMSSIQGKQLTILKQVATQLNSMSSLNKLNTLMEQFAKNVQAASDVLARMASTAGQTATTQQSAAQATQEATATMAQASQQLNQAEINYESLTRTIISYNSEVTELAATNARHRAEMDSLSASMKKVERAYKDGDISLEAYSRRTGELKAQYEQLKASVSQNNAIIRNHSTAIVSTSGSYNEMNAAMLLLQKRFKDLNEAERNSPMGQNLLKQAETLNAKLKEIDAQFGNYQRNVGNYASHWNGLGMSIQQIGRELPSLAMGWNTFFLAISNNLPILTDELARARKEYDELKKSGQAATPVWKQVVSSLLSWQTALTVGITLLSVYGKDIMEWVGNLFKVKDGTEKLEESMKRLNASISEVKSNVSSEISNLNELKEKLESVKKGTSEWNAIRDIIVSRYSEYLPSLAEEIDKTGTLASTYEQLANSIRKVSAVRGYSKAAEEENNKYIELRNKNIQKAYDTFIDEFGDVEGNKFYDEWLKLLDSGEAISGEIQGRLGKISTGLMSNANSLLFEIRQQEQAREAALERYRQIFNLSEEDLSSSTSEAKRRAEEARKIAEEQQKEAEQKAKEYAEYRKKISEDLVQSEIDLLEEGRAKEIAEIKADYDARIKEITGNSEKELALRKNLEELKEKAIQEVNEKYDQQLLDIEKANLENRLAAIGESSQEELNERLKIQLELNEMEKKAELAAAQETGEDATAILGKYEKLKNDIVMKNLAERIGIIESGTDAEIKAQEMDAMRQKNIVAKQYSEGRLSREDYEKALYEIGVNYSKLRLQTMIDEAKKELEISGLPDSKIGELNRRIEQLQAKIDGIDYSQNIHNTEEWEKEFSESMSNMDTVMNESLGDTSDLFQGIIRLLRTLSDEGERSAAKIAASVVQIVNGLSSIMNDIFQTRIDELEEEQEANQEAYDDEVERIETLQERGAISTEEAEARKRAAEERTKVKEEQIAKKRAELEQKQARWDKANAIIQAGIATALAVTKALPNLVLAALVGAMGAAQIAVIAAKQIPQYAKGTKDHPGGLAVVGDGGRKEAVVTDKGVYVTPDRATLVDLPKHAQVVPDIAMLTTRKGLASDFGMLERLKSEKNGQGIVVNVNGGDYRPLETRMDDNTKQLREIRKYLRGRARDWDFMRVYNRL